jgi:hypothetical protein
VCVCIDGDVDHVGHEEGGDGEGWDGGEMSVASPDSSPLVTTRTMVPMIPTTSPIVAAHSIAVVRTESPKRVATICKILGLVATTDLTDSTEPRVSTLGLSPTETTWYLPVGRNSPGRLSLESFIETNVDELIVIPFIAIALVILAGMVFTRRQDCHKREAFFCACLKMKSR